MPESRVPSHQSMMSDQPPVLSRNDWALVRLLMARCTHSDAPHIVKKIDAALSDGYGVPSGT
jgi:hypothetical protein